MGFVHRCDELSLEVTDIEITRASLEDVFMKTLMDGKHRRNAEIACCIYTRVHIAVDARLARRRPKSRRPISIQRRVDVCGLPPDMGNLNLVAIRHYS